MLDESTNQECDDDEYQEPDIDLTIYADGTSIGPDDFESLLNQGVQIFSLPEVYAAVNLKRGINMIGLPLDLRQSDLSASGLLDRLRTHYDSSAKIQTTPTADLIDMAEDVGWVSTEDSPFTLNVVPLFGSDFSVEIEGLGGSPNNLDSWLTGPLTDIGDIDIFLREANKVIGYDYLLEMEGNFGSHTDWKLVEFVYDEVGVFVGLKPYKELGWIIHHVADEDPSKSKFNIFST